MCVAGRAALRARECDSPGLAYYGYFTFLFSRFTDFIRGEPAAPVGLAILRGQRSDRRSRL